jgi:LmbE family N-acetylglucosaminyl deacetylase
MKVSMFPESQAALVIGHPGHELRVYGWLSSVRPQVFVLTDGSGGTGLGRLGSSSQVLTEAGATPGEIYGYFSDSEIYQAVLNHDVASFLAVVDCLVEKFIRGHIKVVVSDANEGFNPTHDLCREITFAAVEKVRRMTARTIPQYEFRLTEWENGTTDTHHDCSIHVKLSDDALAAKLKACLAYEGLRDEVERALAARGAEYFRAECLKRVSGWSPLEDGYKPQYETWGERRVAEGKYSFVLRFQEHVGPIFRALRLHSTGEQYN